MHIPSFWLNKDHPLSSLIPPLLSVSSPRALGEQPHSGSVGYCCFSVVGFHDCWCLCLLVLLFASTSNNGFKLPFAIETVERAFHLSYSMLMGLGFLLWIGHQIFFQLYNFWLVISYAFLELWLSLGKPLSNLLSLPWPKYLGGIFISRHIFMSWFQARRRPSG